MRVQEIWSGYPHATRPRIRAQEVVFRVQAPPVLPYGTPRPKGGMGTVQSKGRAAYLRQLPVACTPARVNGGGVGLQGWQRPEEPGAQQRKRTPIEAQERDRWLAGYRGACASQPACPAPLVVTWPLAKALARRGWWTRGAGSHPNGQRGAAALRVIGAAHRGPRSGMDGPRGSPRPPWGHFLWHAPANRTGRPARAPAR